jgi:phosphoglucosamine mutase
MLGPMPTPAVAYLTRTLRADAGIVISASHNPFYDNGIKFFDADGNKLPDETELAIEAQLKRPIKCVASEAIGKVQRIDDARGRYVEFCKATVDRRLRLNGCKIVLDCANGATYDVAPRVFAELGAQITVIGADPDGLNINADCGSTHPERLQAEVRKQGADLGIAFDGDGDRVLMVDGDGRLLDGTSCLPSRGTRAVGRLTGGVVGTLMTHSA